MSRADERTPAIRSLMVRHSVTVTMTPRQSMEAADALHWAAVRTENGRLFAAASRIVYGLYDAGWETENVGTDDAPKWVWRHAG